MAKVLKAAAIDIGTSAIKLLIGEKDLNSGKITILARYQFPHSVGVRKGEIYDPQRVAKNLSLLQEKIQREQGIKIKKVTVGVGGFHLFSLKSQGLVSVSRADQRISQEDIQRVLQAAQAVNLPLNKEVLEIFPQEFIVDGEGGIKDPLGLRGIRLEAKVILICVFSPVLENLETAILEGGWEIEDVFPLPLASAQSCLSLEQKELGVALVEIGAGTTSVSVFREGYLRELAVFPVGSANITNDIAIGLRVEIKKAEKIKREFGAFPFFPKKTKRKKEKIEIPEEGISISRTFLENIIKSRVSEIFFEIEKVLKKASKEKILPAGVILTGGGASLPGLVEFAKQKFKLPCYLAQLQGIEKIEDLSFSGVAGLLVSKFDLIEKGKEKLKERGILREKLEKIIRMFLP